MGRSSSVYSAYSRVRSIPRTSPSGLTISVTTNTHPPFRFTSLRTAGAVIPALGATANGDGSSTVPIFMTTDCRLVGFHIRCVDLNTNSLAYQVHRQDEPRARTILAHQPAHDSAQRAMNDFDHHA